MELNYLRFLTGKDDDEYYNKFYIKECFNVLNNYFQINIIDVPLELTEEMLEKSNWCKLIHKKSSINIKALSDYYRIYYLNKYDNIIYIDTDVLLSNEQLKKIEYSINYNLNFIVNNTTGTGVYNKYKNSNFCKKFLEFYDNKALEYLKNNEYPIFWLDLNDTKMSLSFKEIYNFNNIDIDDFVHFAGLDCVLHLDTVILFITDYSYLYTDNYGESKIKPFIEIPKLKLHILMSALAIKDRDSNNIRQIKLVKNYNIANLIVILY